MSVTVGTMSVLQNLAEKGHSFSSISASIGRAAPPETILTVINAVKARKARIERERLEALVSAPVEVKAELPKLPPPFIIPGSVAAIVDEVAKKHGLTMTDLRCKGQNKPLVLARHEAMFRAASETLASLPQIGRSLGGRDHTTVINGILRHAQRNGLTPPRGMKPIVTDAGAD